VVVAGKGTEAVPVSIPALHDFIGVATAAGVKPPNLFARNGAFLTPEEKKGMKNYSAGSFFLSSFSFFMFWASAIIPVVSPSPMVFRTEEGTRIRTELFVLSPSYSIFMPLR
jgi:hypothetical protein